MVLAEHLKKLKQQDKSLFEAMSAMLSAQVASRKHYVYVEETIVRSADQFFTSAHGGRRYKRLAPAQEIV